MKIKTITVAGPTASGKTALAVSLAKSISGEIISCDSMQIYRDMNIGTAKPDAAEMDGVPHHMIDVADFRENFSCSDFRDGAMAAVKKIVGDGHIPLLCGGTGLYIDALTEISALSDAECDNELRKRLAAQAESVGSEEMHRRLESVDPESAEKIHPNNLRRVIRALEIFEKTGITKSEWDRRSKKLSPPLDNTMIVLEFQNREQLYSRIDRRVDEMIASGLEDEVRRLYERGLFDCGTTASKAIGYKEFLPYFRGECGIGEVSDKIKQYSRNYAKRQITWFSKYKDAVRIHPDHNSGEMRSLGDIAAEVLERLRELGLQAVK